MLLGWQDVVESTFEVTGKDRDALLLFNFLDELTYRARSNLGGQAFEPIQKDMIIITRLVRAGEDWMISGHPVSFPASVRDHLLVTVAEHGMRRRPAPCAEPPRRTACRPRSGQGQHGLRQAAQPQTRLLLGHRRRTAAAQAQTRLLRRDVAAPDRPALPSPLRCTPAVR
jgi:hypothetical protein